jgi:release factor glutamine methyltransferase
MTTADDRPPVWVVDRLRAVGCVFAEEEAALLVAADGDLEALVVRREAGEPVEQIVGWVEFCGRRIRLLPGVFVPRQRSAVLVAQAQTLLAPGDLVVDLCCGSGALGAVLRDRVAGLVVTAADVDPQAVACARLNLRPDEVLLGDLYDALPDALAGRVQVLVAHAPYVPTGRISSMPPEARDHEHRVALDGGGDGLDVVRRVVAGAPAWLAPGGTLLFETSVGQAAAAEELVAAAGLAARVVHDDEVGATVVLGTRVG